jgi:hypothetical protein
MQLFGRRKFLAYLLEVLKCICCASILAAHARLTNR